MRSNKIGLLLNFLIPQTTIILNGNIDGLFASFIISKLQSNALIDTKIKVFQKALYIMNETFVFLYENFVHA